LSSGDGNVADGAFAEITLTCGSNNIYLGSDAGAATESNSIRIGTQGIQTSAYMAGIYQTMVPHGLTVVVESTGHVGTKGSSARFKQNIKPMNKTSEVILVLQPVTFTYKKELDPEGIPQFGLVAEQVEKVNPDLIVRDEQGKPYTVRYEAVNAMLLNEFLKEHRTVQGQQKEIDALRAELKEQRALIQMVSDKVELNRAAPQTIANNR